MGATERYRARRADTRAVSVGSSARDGWRAGSRDRTSSPATGPKPTGARARGWRRSARTPSPRGGDVSGLANRPVAGMRDARPAAGGGGPMTREPIDSGRLDWIWNGELSERGYTDVDLETTSRVLSRLSRPARRPSATGAGQRAVTCSTTWTCNTSPAGCSTEPTTACSLSELLELFPHRSGKSSNNSGVARASGPASRGRQAPASRGGVSCAVRGASRRRESVPARAPRSSPATAPAPARRGTARRRPATSYRPT
jgi:hypothetical protein